MMSELHFREATPADLESIKSLFIAAIHSISDELYNKAEKAAWSKTAANSNRWKEAIESQFFLLAFKNFELVGFISLENGNYIDFIYVHPSYLRQGIALALYHKVESYALLLGAVTLVSQVSKSAVGFFQKMGYQILRENHNQRNSEVLINYTVNKHLG